MRLVVSFTVEHRQNKLDPTSDVWMDQRCIMQIIRRYVEEPYWMPDYPIDLLPDKRSYTHRGSAPLPLNVTKTHLTLLELNLSLFITLHNTPIRRDYVQER